MYILLLNNRLQQAGESPDPVELISQINDSTLEYTLFDIPHIAMELVILQSVLPIIYMEEIANARMANKVSPLDNVIAVNASGLFSKLVYIEHNLNTKDFTIESKFNASFKPALQQIKTQITTLLSTLATIDILPFIDNITNEVDTLLMSIQEEMYSESNSVTGE